MELKLETVLGVGNLQGVASLGRPPRLPPVPPCLPPPPYRIVKVSPQGTLLGGMKSQRVCLFEGYADLGCPMRKHPRVCRCRFPAGNGGGCMIRRGSSPDVRLSMESRATIPDNGASFVILLTLWNQIPPLGLVYAAVRGRYTLEATYTEVCCMLQRGIGNQFVS